MCRYQQHHDARLGIHIWYATIPSLAVSSLQTGGHTAICLTEVLTLCSALLGSAHTGHTSQPKSALRRWMYGIKYVLHSFHKCRSSNDVSIQQHNIFTKFSTYLCLSWNALSDCVCPCLVFVSLISPRALGVRSRNHGKPHPWHSAR